MARRETVHIIDDIDGESEATQSVDFSYRGKSYRLDLNDENAADFDEALAPYISAAERAGTARSGGGRSARRTPTRSRSASEGPTPADVRAWAAKEGLAVSPRGRISSHVLEQYLAATR